MASFQVHSLDSTHPTFSNMRLDATDLRYISADEFSVLLATEVGSKNAEVVAANEIAKLSRVRHGGVNKLMGELAKRNLIAKVQNIKCE